MAGAGADSGTRSGSSDRRVQRAAEATVASMYDAAENAAARARGAVVRAGGVRGAVVRAVIACGAVARPAAVRGAVGRSVCGAGVTAGARTAHR
ncbi:hypothetical protein JL475_18825 [Streptomyces sp. M2CJ-2]|uniref:hypothetical protein n=1 Tax=Streptomyces sp. M2CJ-2 TaxID=2803948 RepID=UPI0019288A14|nr:hypothetical protein [Streptomyces sp. M2CJ-2]MBL3668007.1 hypothetical protein [Streptomyces sp. M2CJ-2]